MKEKAVVPLRHVPVSFCSSRNVNFHTWHHQDTGVPVCDFRKKPWDEVGVLGSEGKGGCLAPTAGLMPKCH